jgi:hypothetical protein
MDFRLGIVYEDEDVNEKGEEKESGAVNETGKKNDGMNGANGVNGKEKRVLKKPRNVEIY